LKEKDIKDEADDTGSSDALPGSSENRAYERFRVSLKVYIRLSDGSITHAQAVDISMGGIYLEYGASAVQGKVFELAFDLPFADEFKRVLVKGKVVRSVVIGSRSLFGLAFVFTEFAKGAEDTLTKYLDLRKHNA